MSSEQARQFRDRGIALAKARRTAEARQFLQQALRLDPRDETSWLYLASVTEDVKERLLYLRKVLELNPQNEMALKAVRVLGIDPQQLLNTSTGTSATPSVPASAPSAPSTPSAPEPEDDEFDQPAFDAFDEFDEDDDAFADYDAVISAAEAGSTAEAGAADFDESADEEEFELPEYLLELDDDSDSDAAVTSVEDAGEEEFELPDYLLDLDDPDDSPDFTPAPPATGRISSLNPVTSDADDDDIPDYLLGLDDEGEDLSPADVVAASYLPSLDDEDDDGDDYRSAGYNDAIFDDEMDTDAFRKAVFGSAVDADVDTDGDDFADDFEPRSAPAVPERLPIATEGQPRLIPPPRDQSRPGVPEPDQAYLNEVLEALPGIIAPYTEAEAAEPPVEWVRKEKNRAGERDIWVLRSQIAAGVLAGLLVLGVVGWFIVNNVPEVRRVVFAATRTPSLTPSNTPTYTPGFTPTPSATLDTTQFPTYTPSATIPATFTPQGNVNATPRPTELQVPVQPDRAVLDSAVLINQGQFADAAATLQADRESLGETFNPNPYYFEAVALARDGQFSNALNVMNEAEAGLERVSSDDVNRYGPLVNLGFAEVLFEQGETAYANGSNAEGNQRMLAAIERLQAAIQGDPRLGRAYELIAKAYTRLGETTAAIDAVNAGMQFPELADDVAMILAKGQAYLAEARRFAAAGDRETARAQYESADHEAFVAAYLNPYSEEAHQLRITSALERGEPGLAVLYTDTYNLYFPNNPTMFRLRGDARLEEGNIDLAFAAYAQALESGEEVLALVDALAARADLYAQQRRYDLALADYNQALSAVPEDNALRARRMQVAYLAGEYASALEDAQALIGSGALPDTQIRLLNARVLLDQAGRITQNGEAQAGTDLYSEALALLDQIPPGSMSAEENAFADEYRAEAQLVLEDYESALEAINRALEASDSGTRRYLRGRIQEALGDDAAAIRDYEWVLAWHPVFGFSFAEDARDRIFDARERIESQVTPEVTPED